MKRLLFLIIVFSLFYHPVVAQQRVIDAIDKSPVSAASIFDAAGNMVGITLSDGTFTDIPETAYPITLRCIGYEQLVIESSEDEINEMNQTVYELDEFVVVPVKRNILKQTFYVREYFSINTQRDTVTIFIEYMADRFTPASKDARFKSSLRILSTRSYSRYKIEDTDSVYADEETLFPSMLSIINLNDDLVKAQDSFKEQGGDTEKIYEVSGKSGMSLVQKQKAHTFTTIEDVLAGNKDHSISLWPLKLLGINIELQQLYITHAYRVNDEGVYFPKDLIEASFVMEADGTGKKIRKFLNTDKPVDIRSMVELYIVDRDYLSKEEAKEERRNKPDNIKFMIPSTVPPLNDVTQQMVIRANAERKN